VEPLPEAKWQLLRRQVSDEGREQRDDVLYGGVF
jgi:hypothetical protein